MVARAGGGGKTLTARGTRTREPSGGRKFATSNCAGGYLTTAVGQNSLALHRKNGNIVLCVNYTSINQTLKRLKSYEVCLGIFFSPGIQTLLRLERNALRLLHTLPLPRTRRLSLEAQLLKPSRDDTHPLHHPDSVSEMPTLGP